MNTTRTRFWESLGAASRLWKAALIRAWAPLASYAAIYALLLTAPLPPAVVILLVVLELLVWAAAAGALMRLALADRHGDDPAYRLGPLGLQWTGIETRLLGARLLLLLLLFLLLTAAVFCMLLTAVVLAATTGEPPARAGGFFLTPPGVGVLVVGAGFAALTVWLMTRLALASPATADTGRVQAFSTWALTGGAGAWRLLWCMPALTLLVMALGFALRWTAAEAALPAGAKAATAIAFAVLVALVETPLAAGVSAYAYRRLDAG